MLPPPSGESSENQFSTEPITPANSQNKSTSDPALSPPRINNERARYVVIDCLDARKPRQEIRQKLMAYGYSETDADKLIENVEEEQRKTSEYDGEVRGDAKFLMLFGGGACLLGIGVAAGCIIAACYDPNLSQNPLWVAGMFIAGAPVFFGIRLFWRGFSL